MDSYRHALNLYQDNPSQYKPNNESRTSRIRQAGQERQSTLDQTLTEINQQLKRNDCLASHCHCNGNGHEAITIQEYTK